MARRAINEIDYVASINEVDMRINTLKQKIENLTQQRKVLSEQKNKVDFANLNNTLSNMGMSIEELLVIAQEKNGIRII